MKPEEIARNFVARWLGSDPSSTYLGRDRAEAELTQAIVADRARARAEAIEECAKVAEHRAYDMQCRQGERPLIVDTANYIASAIRALGGKQ